MIDFDSDIDKTPSATVPASKPAPTVVERVRVAPATEAMSFLAKPSSMWNWSDLRDYIVKQIEDRHGPMVRNLPTEASICKSFISRWGIETAVAIAKAAFEVHGGYWNNAPISINRFCKGSDQWFAAKIVENLA